MCDVFLLSYELLRSQLEIRIQFVIDILHAYADHIELIIGNYSTKLLGTASLSYDCLAAILLCINVDIFQNLTETSEFVNLLFP